MYILKTKDVNHKFSNFRNELKKALERNGNLTNAQIESKLPTNENLCKELFIKVLKRDNVECELLQLQNLNGIQTELVLYKK